MPIKNPNDKKTDQYGRPIKRESNLDSYLYDPTSGVSKGYLAPLDIVFSLFGDREVPRPDLTPKERAAYIKKNNDSNRILRDKAKKDAIAKAVKEAAKPAPKPVPRTKGGPIAPSKPGVGKIPAPLPTKPDIKTKNAPMPYNKKTYVPHYGKA